MQEINYARLLFHVFGGLFGAAVAWVFPFPEILTISITFFGIAVIIEILRSRSREFDDLFRARYATLMKPTEHGTILGFTWVTGAALLLGFLQDFRPMVLGMLVWAFADPMAMIAGKTIRDARPITKGKTLEGSIAFFLTATLTAALVLFSFEDNTLTITVMAPAIGAVGTFAEAISRKILIDDNFSIPLFVGLTAFFFLV